MLNFEILYNIYNYIIYLISTECFFKQPERKISHWSIPLWLPRFHPNALPLLSGDRPGIATL